MKKKNSNMKYGKYEVGEKSPFGSLVEQVIFLIQGRAIYNH